MKKRLIIIAVIIILYIAFDVAYIRYKTGCDLYKICTWLSCYIDQNNAMPTSKNDLILKGYLQLVKPDSVSNKDYLLRYGQNMDCVIQTDALDDYFIGYGKDFNDLKERSGTIYDKGNEQVFLIKGKHKFIAKDLYEKYSLILYKRFVSTE